MLPHDFNEEIQLEPTCTEFGLIVKTCKVCSKVEDVQIDKLGHDMHIIGETPATCTESKIIHKICSRECGYTQDIMEGLPNGHDYESFVSLEPTCTKEGSEHKVCKVCHDTRDEVISSLRHDMKTIRETSATCTKAGILHQECSRNCGYKEDKFVGNALGHKFNKVVIAILPTCTENGLMYKVCNVCNEIMPNSEMEIEVLGHAWDRGVVAQKATVSHNGVMKYTCTRDKSH